MRLKDKVALVTGAGSGIGRACAAAFAREGARVGLVGRRRSPLDDLAREIGDAALVLPGDVSSRDDVARVVSATASRFGAIHVLVNNAGVLVPATAEEVTEEQWDRTFNINVRGVWLLSREVLRHMRQAGGGSIINISSVLGLVGARKRAAYAASKGAVTLLTRCMAIDHAADKVRVNCICPGFVETELTNAFVRQAPDPEALLRERRSVHPIGRLGRPEDIAAMAVYLASDESSWVTGAALPVDGGYSAI